MTNHRRCTQLRRTLELCLSLLSAGDAGRTLADLAAPAGVHERTIRRDLALLVSMGWVRYERRRVWVWAKGREGRDLIDLPSLDDVATFDDDGRVDGMQFDGRARRIAEWRERKAAAEFDRMVADFS